MTNKKFTLAAIAAAAITTAPIAVPVIGAITTMPVMAADTATSSKVAVSGSVAVKNDNTLIYNNKNVTASQSSYAYKGQTFTVVSKVTLGDGAVFYVTTAGKYLPAGSVDDSNATTTITNNTSSTSPVSGSVVIKNSNTLVFNNKNVTASQSTYASKGDTFSVVSKVTLANGSVFYITNDGKYVDADTVDASKVKDESDAAQTKGVATINYNKNYGIQIWTKAGQPVKFNDKDTATWNKLHPNNKVKVGDAKKLPGKTSWKVFKNTYTAHGTTYYNLGGDQYIDANYVTFK